MNWYDIEATFSANGYTTNIRGARVEANHKAAAIHLFKETVNDTLKINCVATKVVEEGK